MTALILDGKKAAEKIKNEIKLEISLLEKKPSLAVIIVGDFEPSKIYVSNKEKACKEVGILSKTFSLKEDVSEEELLGFIEKLNNDSNVNGVLVQLPLPKHIDSNKILNSISPIKDVDGLHALNVGNLVLKNETMIPCTPKGIISLLESNNINLDGKNVVIINRSNIVGRPLSILFLNKNSTVTICHTHTEDINFYSKNADILVTGVGKPNFITKDKIKDGVIVVDVSMNRIGSKLCGDVDFENVKGKASYITPVPGGVGPMTIASLLENVLKAYKQQNQKVK